MPDHYLTVRQVAERLQFDEQTVWSWIRSGCAVAGRVVKLQASRVGPRQYRVSEEQLRLFLADCNPGASGPAMPRETPTEASRAAARRLGWE